MIRALDNIGIAVRDVLAAVAWYQRFGFVQEWGDETQAWLVGPGVNLYLFRTGALAGAPRSFDLEGNPPGFDHVSFNVTDVDAACAELAAAGVSPERPPQDYDWGARAASFRDPDGNCIWLLQRK